MNKALLFAIPLIVAGAVVAAVYVTKKPQEKAKDLAGTTLRIYTWDTYIAPNIFKEFEAETGIKVETAIFDNNDTLIKELAEGKPYDLVTPSGNYIWHLVEKKLLSPLPDRLKGLGEHLAEPVKAPPYDPNYKWGLPVFYGTTALAVNTRETSEDVISWKQLFERPAGEEAKIGMLDEVASVITAASFALGATDCDTSEATMARIRELLEKQAPAVKTYSSETYYERLAAGEVKLQMAWSGDVFIARRKNAAVKYIYPKEGVDLWMDELAIPVTAQNKEAAARFIEFIHEPKRLADYAVVTGNIPAVAASLDFLPADMKDAPEFHIPPGTRAVVTQACAPEKAAAYAALVEPFLTK